jgi:hypothetical protein
MPITFCEGCKGAFEFLRDVGGKAGLCALCVKMSKATNKLEMESIAVGFLSSSKVFTLTGSLRSNIFSVLVVHCLQNG